MNLDSMKYTVEFVLSLVNQLSEAPSVTKFVIYGILAIFVISLLLTSIRFTLEHLASIVENLKKIGLPLANSQEQKMAVRRRQQFCNVLRSDLDAIAKAENWNDQWFTDLEAEVDAEGGYYANTLARYLGRRSNGIRRAPSLIQAIQSSTERCMLLVGDPGSGKSVALRHLGRTLAEAGSRSKATHTQVPLYVNLKELPTCELDDLNPDFIETFVKDHIRRGDADTAAYVRDQWDLYKRQGLWFFLFDSFDEIPAVLHAPNGSKIIELYSQALRKFMDGMGECRSVLASREYKGPEALPWQKLRILALNQMRQDELIDNTFLTHQSKQLVRQHLATTGGGIFGNPLFLSLLCRYVGDTKKMPSNDYDLLLRHIERLALRDPDFIFKRYQLTAVQLLEGATILAVLFAEVPELSLAPKHDEIQHALIARQQPLPIDLESLLAALVDIKIGRSDVKEARAGDRRFTFSHRRYQETLFVQYLANHPDHISAESLLFEERWREFAVTLIQSQPSNVVKRISDEAVRQINAFVNTGINLPKELSADLHYFEWSNQPITYLLQLLNEGFAQRRELVPDSLRAAILKQLIPRWETGDIYDKLMVIRIGCLLPTDKYQELLTSAINSKMEIFLQASFSNGQFLTEFPAWMEEWIRKRFSDEIILAENKILLRKLDAFGNRLPPTLGAGVIFNRCQTLRSLIYQPLIFRAAFKSFNKINNRISPSIFSGHPHMKVALAALAYIYIIATPIMLIAVAAVKTTSTYSMPMSIIAACALILAVMPIFSLMLRDQPMPITSSRLSRLLFNVIATNISIANFLGIAFAILITAGLVWATTKFEPAVLILGGLIFLIGIVVIVIEHREEREALRHLDETVRNKNTIWEQIKEANTVDELQIWLNKKSKEWLNSTSNMRSILCYAQDRFSENDEANGSSTTTMNVNNFSVYSNLLARLETK